MSTIALRQAMVPTVFFTAGLSLLTISYLPSIQQQRLPPYPPSALPYAASPPAPASTAPSVVPVPPSADITRQILKLSVPPAHKEKIANPVPRGNDVLNKPRVNGKEIPTTTNNKIRKENPVTIGRDDPFKSLIVVRKQITLPVPPPFPMPNETIMEPPPPPGALPSVTPPAPPQPSLAPAPDYGQLPGGRTARVERSVPAPQLKVGLSLQGMVGGDPADTAAILTIDGNTQLVHMGDVIRRPGFILTIVGINERALSITLSDGKGHLEVLKTE